MGQPAEARTHFIGCAVDAHPADVIGSDTNGWTQGWRVCRLEQGTDHVLLACYKLTLLERSNAPVKCAIHTCISIQKKKLQYLLWWYTLAGTHNGIGSGMAGRAWPLLRGAYITPQTIKFDHILYTCNHVFHNPLPPVFTALDDTLLETSPPEDRPHQSRSALGVLRAEKLCNIAHATLNCIVTYFAVNLLGSALHKYCVESA